MCSVPPRTKQHRHLDGLSRRTIPLLYARCREGVLDLLLLLTLALLPKTWLPGLPDLPRSDTLCIDFDLV